MFSVVSNKQKSSFQRVLVKMRSLSKMIISGNPWSLYTLLKYNCAMESVVYG
jgi:hypothetical protein